MMKYRILVPAHGAEAARELVVQQTDFLIGRGADCDIRLIDSTISRHHCILHSSAEELHLLDLGSSNGTYLNGQRVRSQAVIHSGDTLLLGPHRFQILFGEDGREPGDDPAAVTQRTRAPRAE